MSGGIANQLARATGGLGGGRALLDHLLEELAAFLPQA
jgi:hypothetical protein